MTDARLGKIPTPAVRRFDLFVEPLERFGAADPGRWVSGKAKWLSRSRLGRGEQLGDLGIRSGHPVDHPVELLPGRRAVGLLEDRPDGGGDHAPGRPGHEILGVAAEVDPAALPVRAEQLLVHRLDQARVVVADDEADPVEPAFDEAPG